MSKISQSVLNSLSILVDGQLNYICLVEYKQRPFYLALGQECFYFITEELDMYKDPPVPYSKIKCIRIGKHKTLMQIQLKKAQALAFGQTLDENDPKVKLQRDLDKTYGGKLDVYNQDRKAAIDSFRCYWQIDYMM